MSIGAASRVETRTFSCSVFMGVFCFRLVIVFGMVIFVLVLPMVRVAVLLFPLKLSGVVVMVILAKLSRMSPSPFMPKVFTLSLWVATFRKILNLRPSLEIVPKVSVALGTFSTMLGCSSRAIVRGVKLSVPCSSCSALFCSSFRV